MRPVKKKVLVEPILEENKTSSGIEYVEARTKNHSKGEVLAIGESVTQVAVGNTIFYSPLAYEEVGEGQHIVHEDDIHAILE